jgi:protein-ribulosamine 3-kinase
MINWSLICSRISEATQARFVLTNSAILSGGCTNQSWHVQGQGGSSNQPLTMHYFVKLNTADKAAMFAAECAGLEALADTHTVRVPRIVCTGVAEQHSYLVLEHFKLQHNGNAALLGQQLADLHRTQSTQYGWDKDNTLAITPQHNVHSADWLAFWREQRLGFQLELAAKNGFHGSIQKLGRSVLDALPDLLADYSPAASLLHGDLWGGNHAFLADGMPIIFDPAPYYGDRETDIAMTELFGGFDADFYTAYQDAYPLDIGYAKRKNLYNLYHILNHCNLFGGSYTGQAESLMRGLLTKHS